MSEREGGEKRLTLNFQRLIVKGRKGGGIRKMEALCSCQFFDSWTIPASSFIYAGNTTPSMGFPAQVEISWGGKLNRWRNSSVSWGEIDFDACL